LRAGLFTVDDLKEMPLTADIIADIDRHYPSLDQVRRGAELVRELISHFISAVFTEASRRLAAAQPQSADDVRHHNAPLIGFPTDVAEQEAAIKSFLYRGMYRHHRVMQVMRDAEQVVRDLFERYRESPGDLPAEWIEGTGEEMEGVRDRRIGDFIAGMTDRFALIEHHRLFDSTPDLR
jgi:dGTPase